MVIRGVNDFNLRLTHSSKTVIINSNIIISRLFGHWEIISNIDFTDVLSDGRPQLGKGLRVETREAGKDYGDEENTALRLGG